MSIKVPVFCFTAKAKDMENMGSMLILVYTDMRRVTTFQSTTDHIYDGVPIILWYNDTYHCVKIAYSIQYSNMLYRFEA